MVAVAVDLSDPKCASRLHSLLAQVHSTLAPLFSPSQSSGSDGITSPHVLVVGCKADTLEASDVEGMRCSKMRQGELRAVCLHGTSWLGRIYHCVYRS